MPVKMLLSISVRLCMCNQMVTSEIREYFHARFVKILLISRAFRRGKLLKFDKTQVKLFPNFTSIPTDYLLIPWVTNYAHNRGFFDLFMVSQRIEIELHALKSLKHAFWLKFT